MAESVIRALSKCRFDKAVAVDVRIVCAIDAMGWFDILAVGKDALATNPREQGFSGNTTGRQRATVRRYKRFPPSCILVPSGSTTMECYALQSMRVRCPSTRLP
jgi:hypothetical protein